MSSVIATSGLSKRYGDVIAVNALNLNVRAGEIYGFLGRNGAGKTTTIRMLLGLVQPSAGEVRMLGARVEPASQSTFARVGYLVESASAYPNLTVRENLDLQRRLMAAPSTSVPEVIDLLGLDAYADRRAGRLSLGNKQRLSLARALLHRPDVLILDEPANALDPAGIIEIRQLLRRLADDRGVTVFMSSHILAEVAQLADRIGIVHEGRLIEELAYDELRARTRRYIEVIVSEPGRARALLGEHLGITQIELADDGSLRVSDVSARPEDIARVVVGAGLSLQHLTTAQEDLEEYFMRLTGGDA